MAEHRVLAAGVAQVAGQGQFVAATPGPPADGGDADERRLREPQDEIDGGWLRGKAGGLGEVEWLKK
jgi:hypothetical protein